MDLGGFPGFQGSEVFQPSGIQWRPSGGPLAAFGIELLLSPQTPSNLRLTLSGGLEAWRLEAWRLEG